MTSLTIAVCSEKANGGNCSVKISEMVSGISNGSGKACEVEVEDVGGASSRWQPDGAAAFPWISLATRSKESTFMTTFVRCRWLRQLALKFLLKPRHIFVVGESCVEPSLISSEMLASWSANGDSSSSPVPGRSSRRRRSSKHFV